MAHDFYNTNLNPITMYGVSTDTFKRAEKPKYIKADVLDDYVSSVCLINSLEIGAKKLKALFGTIGEYPKVNQGTTYYRKDKVEALKKLIEDDKNNKIVDYSKYIPKSEVIEMFGFTTSKVFYFAEKHNLTKHNFGKITYYNREKAIEIFSKLK